LDGRIATLVAAVPEDNRDEFAESFGSLLTVASELPGVAQELIDQIDEWSIASARIFGLLETTVVLATDTVREIERTLLEIGAAKE
jgi:hypothetical protein